MKLRRLNYTVLFPLLVALALIGYLLPWIIQPASSLSLGAYDLAEWSSLHPIVRQTIPFLWTALMLRIPLAVLGILMAAYIGETFPQTPIALGCLLVAAIALLPPLEFFTTFRDDPNYSEQFVLALFTIAVGVPVTEGKPKKMGTSLIISLSVIGALSSALGLYQAQNLMQSFALHTAIGSGGVITSVALAATAFFSITKQSS